MGYNLISGTSQRFYHTIESDLDAITTSPTREGIFKNLSQIGYDKFPEFILDILVKVEGHTAVDVTDGQGDEKQDILTTNTKGERCITQCKHTGNYQSHYNGNDLDTLVVASMRKDCQQGIFVTNADLTPQGKKYINDEEYNRGIKSPEDLRDISYWNGFKIWEKIKNNKDILNKWFSDLGQVHSLRSFKFDLTVQEFPYDDNRDEGESFNNIIAKLKSKKWVKEVEEGLVYRGNFSSRYEVHFKRWFQFTGGLDINFIPPGNNLDFINKALYALTIEVKIKSDKNYSPSIIRQDIVNKIAKEILPISQPGKTWWHITTSKIKSFIYIHDIQEPREIDLTSSLTFISTENGKVFPELKYCTDLKGKFKTINVDEDIVMVHRNSGISVIPYFEQKIDPVQQYDNQIIQQRQLAEIASYNFFAVKNIDSSYLMRVRRLLDHHWVALQMDDDTIIWAVDPDTDPEKIDLIHGRVETLGVSILRIPPEEIPKILKNIQKDLSPSTWMYTPDIDSISFPILLEKRIFWLSKEFSLAKEIDVEMAMELLKYKYTYESRNGFDNMVTDQMATHSTEIKSLLLDILNIRGTKMLDLGFSKNTITLYMRFREIGLESADVLAAKYIKEFQKVMDEIQLL